MIPFALLAGMTVFSGVTTGYQIGTWIKSYQHKLARNAETERWWNDYFRNTGLSPEDVRYPYKIGYMDSAVTDLALGYEGSQFVSSNVERLYKRW